ncbi:MAG TPA: exodeoxyribonuclease V subunit beta [Flavitalea sp.]|nr:exodeoxyribonuclease V subunit beta [Flavitalea sp.]
MRQDPFISTEVVLEGTNLIEASAGTGKTYSIAIMVLRLVLEVKLPVKEILMVTFTKAAVAELEERVREFIRNAYRASTGHTVSDKTIQLVVDRQIARDGIEEVQNRLQAAVLFLDESAVMTIHGFCQQTLTEFAFEAGQIFGAETIQDIDLLVEEQLNKFWRKEVTTMPEPLLAALLKAGLTRELLRGVISAHLGGKRYLPYEEGKVYDCSGEQHQQWMAELKELQQKEKTLHDSIVQFIESNRDRLFSQGEKDHNVRKGLNLLVDHPEEWFQLFRTKKDKGYASKLFPDVLALCNDCDDANERLQKQYKKILSHLYCMAIAVVSQQVALAKERQNLVAFDDMIQKVHAALTRKPNPRLVESLQKKYKAVLIDEFQDTDKLQYEIFETAFRTNTIVFFIGDPKQSIYAWRKADLHTYFKARKGVDNVYAMNVNYRSSAAYIHSMNEFLSIDDTFLFKGESDGIEYVNVQAPGDSHKGELLLQGAPMRPITIVDAVNKDDADAGLVADVIRLLDKDQYTLRSGDKNDGLRPSDIGILVRTNKQAASIKTQLARYGIPAVTIGDERVLESDEAKMVWYFLIAMEEPSRGNINRALLGPLTGYNADTILLLKEEVVTDLFRGYRKTWEESGVYTAMMNIVTDFNIRNYLLSGHSEQGERSITNLFQLIELLHKMQVRQNFSLLELISWLKRGIDGMRLAGDEFEQRVESDEESVKIVTIHKSKGLEYNVVLSSSLDMAKSNSNKAQTTSFRNPQSNEYVSIDNTSLTTADRQLAEDQENQEKRRMLYVALTRAVYKCFIYKNGKAAKNSTLTPFIDGRFVIESSLVEIKQPAEPPGDYRYRQEAKTIPVARKAENFELHHINWRKASYTSIAAKHEFRIKPITGGHLEAYDRFIFYQLLKGAHTGNLLHYIFEHVNFASDSNWSYVINKAITQFVPGKRELYSPLLLQLVETIVHVPIKINNTEFTLSQVGAANRLHEFEFDFSINSASVSALNSLSNSNVRFAIREQADLEGLMNGLIDLLFLHEGKYYILDWKSNYLGDRVEDYSIERLGEAMNDNNYHLQYLLYTIAVKKYLRSRLGETFNYEEDFGGVIYLFVRGIRKKLPHGIFTIMPSSELVEKLEHYFDPVDSD